MSPVPHILPPLHRPSVWETLVPLAPSRRLSQGDVTPQKTCHPGCTQPQEARASLLRDGKAEARSGQAGPRPQRWVRAACLSGSGPNTRAEHLLCASPMLGITRRQPAAGSKGWVGQEVGVVGAGQEGASQEAAKGGRGSCPHECLGSSVNHTIGQCWIGWGAEGQPLVFLGGSREEAT